MSSLFKINKSENSVHEIQKLENDSESEEDRISHLNLLDHNHMRVTMKDDFHDCKTY